MGTYFRLEQAERLLPSIERAILDAVFLKSECEVADKELHGVSRRILLAGGMQVNEAHLLALKQRRDSSAARLNEAIEKIH